MWDSHFDPKTNIVEIHVSRLCGKICRGETSLELTHTIRSSGYALRAAVPQAGVPRAVQTVS